MACFKALKVTVYENSKSMACTQKGLHLVS